jgi:hypothetical protein
MGRRKAIEPIVRLSTGIVNHVRADQRVPTRKAIFARYTFRMFAFGAQIPCGYE